VIVAVAIGVGVNLNLPVTTQFASRELDPAPRQCFELVMEDNMPSNWREFIVLTIFVLLFGAALIANLSDGSLSHVRGAWVTQAMR
jgi:hypothetical protein